MREEGEPTEWAGVFGPPSVSQREEVTAHKGKGPILEGKGEKERGWSYWGPSLPPTSQSLSSLPTHPPTTP